jgi:hypothetical protein
MGVITACYAAFIYLVYLYRNTILINQSLQFGFLSLDGGRLGIVKWKMKITAQTLKKFDQNDSNLAKPNTRETQRAQRKAEEMGNLLNPPSLSELRRKYKIPSFSALSLRSPRLCGEINPFAQGGQDEIETGVYGCILLSVLCKRVWH